jgi:2-dehydropantoate 2-reductase
VRPRVAVVGPGAIGGTLAAHLAQRGPALDVVICARTPFDALVLDTPEGTLRAQVPVLCDPAAARPVDWVLLAVKTYDVAEAARRWLPGLLGPETRVAALQNGLEHRSSLDGHVPAERVLPTVQMLPAERVGPGHLRQRRPGALSVPTGAEADAFAALFEGTAIPVHRDPAFDVALWTKLAVNAAGAVSAMRLEPARVVHAPGAADEMRALVAECVAVARACGVELPADLPERVVEGARAAPPETSNSLLADRRAGRPLEIDARHGVIVRLGRAHSVPTPENARVCRVLGTP